MKKKAKKMDVKEGEQSWLYSKIVKDHFFHPRNVLLDEKNYQYDGKGISGNALCGDMMVLWIKVDKKTQKIKDCKWRTYGSLLPGAKILMDDFTTKPIEEIKRGDAIIDGDGKKNFVEETLVQNYKGKVITLQLSTSKFYKFTLTPNHPVPVIKRRSIALIQRISGNRWSEVSLKKINDSEITVIPAAELKKGDFLLFQVPMEIRDRRDLDGDICKILGYYVSDGSSPSKNRVIFYFGLDEKKYINEVIGIAKKKKWHYRVYRRNDANVICVQINEVKVVELLRRHGGLPSKKRFSREVLLLSPKKQQKIIDAYIAGDGWIIQQKPNWHPTYYISTSKEEIAYQLQIMLGRLKIFAPIYKREPRNFLIRGKQYKNSGEINLVFRKNQKYSRIKYHKKQASFLIPISSIEIDEYRGKIYDISLAYEPRTYRVNGISLHNCASAIAATSMMSVMVKENGGMPIKKALRLKPQQIIKRLGGLPKIKFHCSVLGLTALKEAINDYLCSQKKD